MTVGELIQELNKYNSSLLCRVMVIDGVYCADVDIDKVVSRDKDRKLPGYQEYLEGPDKYCKEYKSPYIVEEPTLFLIVNDPDNEVVTE